MTAATTAATRTKTARKSQMVRIRSYLCLADKTRSQNVGLVHRRFLGRHPVVQFLKEIGTSLNDDEN